MLDQQGEREAALPLAEQSAALLDQLTPPALDRPAGPELAAAEALTLLRSAVF
jgi:hypothetical protein